jgi:hypothetical protein
VGHGFQGKEEVDSRKLKVEREAENGGVALCDGRVFVWFEVNGGRINHRERRVHRVGEGKEKGLRVLVAQAFRLKDSIAAIGREA